MWAEDIKGIVYYLDNNGNVYNTEDIVSSNPKPRIIFRYTKCGSNYELMPF